MQFCVLDLGPDPWARLGEGRISGSMRWNDLPPLSVVVSIRGAHSRRFSKRSLRVRLREERLPDGPPDDHTVDCIHLNADYIDPTLMRSALSYSCFAALGVPSPRCRHTALTVSGQFAGLYMALESVDRDFCHRQGWRPGPIYYAINRHARFAPISPVTSVGTRQIDDGYIPVPRSGDRAPLRHMLEAAILASDRRFAHEIERWVAVEGYLQWLAVAVFVGNRDGFSHNYALSQDPDTGRFRIIPWDYDATWGIDINGRPARLDRVPLMGGNGLTRRLLAIPRYRHQYKQILRQALCGPLSPCALRPVIDNMAEELAPWMEDESTRYGGLCRFLEEVDRLKVWAHARGELLAEQLAI